MSLQSIGLIPARWKGVAFLVSRETLTSLGQKFIVHDYPNTGIRYAEPHGKVPFQCEIEITFSGITFKNDFLAFKEAMEDPSPGTLYLPTLGVFSNIVALPASASSDHSAYGQFSFTVQFTETVAQPSPQAATAGQQDVQNAGTISLAKISGSLQDKFLPPGTMNNLMTAISDVTTAIGIFQAVSGAIGLASLMALNLSKVISNPAGLASLLLDPTNGAISLVNLAMNGTPTAYNNYRKLTTVGNNLSNTMWDIVSNFQPKVVGVIPPIDFSSVLPAWVAVTLEQAQRNNNRYAVINSLRLAALVGMCEQAGIQSFTTVAQVQNTIKDINNLFNVLIENDTTGVIIPDIKTEMEILKNATISTLYSIEQNVFNTEVVKLPQGYPPRVLVYELYGEFIQNESDFDFYSEILVNLNNNQPAHLFTGDVTILQN